MPERHSLARTPQALALKIGRSTAYAQGCREHEGVEPARGQGTHTAAVALEGLRPPGLVTRRPLISAGVLESADPRGASARS